MAKPILCAYTRRELTSLDIGAVAFVLGSEPAFSYGSLARIASSAVSSGNVGLAGVSWVLLISLSYYDYASQIIER
jgi:hypothetical protein